MPGPGTKLWAASGDPGTCRRSCSVSAQHRAELLGGPREDRTLAKKSKEMERCGQKRGAHYGPTLSHQIGDPCSDEV